MLAGAVLAYCRIVTSFIVQSAGLISPSHLTPQTSHFTMYQLSISSGAVFGVGGRPRGARCEVSCFDVHYGNLGQTHSVQVET